MLHEPTSSPCLDLENDRYRYEKSPPPSPPFVFGRTPSMEEFVCLGGSALPKTVEFPQLLAIIPAEADLSTGFLEDYGTRFLREDLEIKVFDISEKLSDFSEEAIQESGMQLALVSQDVGNPNFWNQSKFDVFSNFLSFSTIEMEKEILKSSRVDVPRGRRFSPRNSWRTLSLKES